MKFTSCLKQHTNSWQHGVIFWIVFLREHNFVGLEYNLAVKTNSDFIAQAQIQENHRKLALGRLGSGNGMTLMTDHPFG